MANYVDSSPSQALSAILRWCDTCGLYPLRQLAPSSQELLMERWSRQCVMRSIKLWRHVDVWEVLFQDLEGTKISVTPKLQALGRTSYTLRFQLSLKCQA